MSDILVTRLDIIPITILDQIQSQMDPDALVNRVVIVESIERDIPNIVSGSYHK